MTVRRSDGQTVGSGSMRPSDRPTVQPSEYQRIISGIVTWVQDVMSDPAGGYYSGRYIAHVVAVGPIGPSELTAPFIVRRGK